MKETPFCIALNDSLYRVVPAATLRNTVDTLFPTLAKNSTADCVAGALHRYRGGHDLILDVGKTMTEQGLGKGLKHAGHILLTDFPTKAGIPIPLLSQKGFGGVLQSWGVSPKWLNINLGDTLIGGLTLVEGSSDLSAALAGQMPMDFSTFCDTFGEGALEIGAGVYSHNPLLLAAGAENLTAGLVAAWKHFSWYVPPELFLGSTLLSGAAGFIVSKFVLKQETHAAFLNSCRSALTGGLFTVSAAFGWGLIGTMIWTEVIRRIAEKHTKSLDDFYRVADEQLESLKSAYSKLSPGFEKMYEQSRSRKAAIKNPPRRLDIKRSALPKLPELPGNLRIS
ncbi:MAG: hypothetical protein IKB99_07790 [Lentisphaeria bacterium]|nr:hypothetical protein [Lentisphaeria bacterium]